MKICDIDAFKKYIYKYLSIYIVLIFFYDAFHLQYEIGPFKISPQKIIVS